MQSTSAAPANRNQFLHLRKRNQFSLRKLESPFSGGQATIINFEAHWLREFTPQLNLLILASHLSEKSQKQVWRRMLLFYHPPFFWIHCWSCRVYCRLDRIIKSDESHICPVYVHYVFFVVDFLRLDERTPAKPGYKFINLFIYSFLLLHYY